MIDRIKSALTRKFGPLPAWAWLGILGFGYYYYQKHYGSGAVSGTGTGSVTPTPPTPQDPVTLDPGESVYDPNTGALETAPGGGGSTDTSGTDVGSALEDLANSIQGALNQANSPVGTATPPATLKPKGKRKIKRTKKTKPEKTKPKKTKPESKIRARSKATTRPKTGGRLVGRLRPASGTLAPTRRKPRGPSVTGSEGTPRTRRSRPKTPPTSRVVRQRPTASHAAPRRAPAPARHTARRRRK